MLGTENADPWELIKLPDFISNMPMLYSFRTFPLPWPIVECLEETTARLPK